MAPPSLPKRPSGPPRDVPPRKKPGLELPFDDEEPRPRSEAGSRSRVQPQPSGAARYPTRDGYADADDEGPTDPEQPAPAGVKERAFSQAFLSVERGPNAGESVYIPQGLMYIGRASNSNLHIQHPSISRRHAQITRNGERFFIRDLASQNGTWVNQVRIEKEVELFPGDEIVAGVAQIRLQAAGASNAPRTRPVPGSGRGLSPFGIAVAAAVLGFGLAAIVMLAWFRISRGPSYEDLGSEPVKERPAPVQRAPVEVPAPVEPRSAPVEPKPAPKATDASPPGAVESKPAAPAEPKRGGGPALAIPSDATPEEKPATREAARLPPDPGNDPTVLARFEAGKLDAALELAKKKNARELLAKLTRFQGLYESGQRELATHDDAGALKHLDASLKLAEQLSGGWDKYSTDLRHQLSDLHLAAGTRLAPGNPAAARKELGLALQYDPDNGKARKQLSELEGGAGGPATKREATRSAIDAAFGGK